VGFVIEHIDRFDAEAGFPVEHHDFRVACVEDVIFTVNAVKNVEDTFCFFKFFCLILEVLCEFVHVFMDLCKETEVACENVDTAGVMHEFVGQFAVSCE